MTFTVHFALLQASRQNDLMTIYWSTKPCGSFKWPTINPILEWHWATSGHML